MVHNRKQEQFNSGSGSCRNPAQTDNDDGAGGRLIAKAGSSVSSSSSGSFSSRNSENSSELNSSEQIITSLQMNSKKAPTKISTDKKQSAPAPAPAATATLTITTQNPSNSIEIKPADEQQVVKEVLLVNKQAPKQARVLDPSGSLCYHWSMVVSFAFLYNFWSLSYRFAFREIDFDTVEFWFTLDYLADFIYILDVVINFHTGYLEDGVLQRNIDKIGQHYRECTLFYLDCFCLLPLDILYLSIGFNSILRCTRLVKIYKFWSYADRTERHTNYPNVFRTFTLVHYILVIFHWNACLFHMISKNKILDIENLYKINDNRCEDILCQYLHAFYWSTLALTTIGDLPKPRTKGEYFYVTLELFFGLFLFASVLGHVANIVTNVSAARKEFQAKLDAVKTFMRMRRVSDELQNKVIRWFDYLWVSQKSSDEERSVACLPDRLKAEIAIHVHLDTLKRVDIFQNTEAGFLCELVLRLKPVLFSPGDYVCRKNEVGHEMYIVSKGILEVVTDGGKSVVATLKAGSYFGEISVLNVGLAGNKRTASVRSVGYSDLFCLNKQDLWDVLKNYPNAEARIRARAEERLSKLDINPSVIATTNNSSCNNQLPVHAPSFGNMNKGQIVNKCNYYGYNTYGYSSCSSMVPLPFRRNRICSSGSSHQRQKSIRRCQVNQIAQQQQQYPFEPLRPLHRCARHRHNNPTRLLDLDRGEGSCEMEVKNYRQVDEQPNRGDKTSSTLDVQKPQANDLQVERDHIITMPAAADEPSLSGHNFQDTKGNRKDSLVVPDADRGRSRAATSVGNARSNSIECSEMTRDGATCLEHRKQSATTCDLTTTTPGRPLSGGGGGSISGDSSCLSQLDLASPYPKKPHTCYCSSTCRYMSTMDLDTLDSISHSLPISSQHLASRSMRRHYHKQQNCCSYRTTGDFIAPSRRSSIRREHQQLPVAVTTTAVGALYQAAPTLWVQAPMNAAQSNPMPQSPLPQYIQLPLMAATSPSGSDNATTCYQMLQPIQFQTQAANSVSMSRLDVHNQQHLVSSTQTLPHNARERGLQVAAPNSPNFLLTVGQQANKDGSIKLSHSSQSVWLTQQPNQQHQQQVNEENKIVFGTSVETSMERNEEDANNKAPNNHHSTVGQEY